MQYKVEGVEGVGGGRLGQRDRRHPKGGIVGEGVCGDFVCGIGGGGGGWAGVIVASVC